MRTVLLGPPPAELEAWLEQRRARGQDLFDEVWEGEYHVAPAPHRHHGLINAGLIRLLGPAADRAGLWATDACNIGGPDDYRVPDQAYFRDRAGDVWNPTAAIVVEIVSPGDESREKLPFYHRAGIEEVLIVDAEARSVEWFRRSDSGFELTDRSELLGVSGAELADAIDWPA
jgi:Uma2 family endonuclease